MNEIKPQSGLVRQNEVLIKENNNWLYFSKPHQIITVQKLEDILPALQEIERLIAVNDWYAAGFLSYEAASAFDSALQTRLGDGFPYLWFGLYSEPRIITLPRPEAPKQSLAWLPTTDRESYHAAIRKIKRYIADGKTYQVNYTMRLQTDFTGNVWDFFLHLAQNQNNHAAYIDIDRYVICSASPELFFQLDGNMITCRPMKGTTKRGRTTVEDKEQSNWLEHSEKNRAENVMIVDMIRNDLGKIAEVGSVHVPHLFETERYPTLWQMTSTVTAKTNASLTEILKALFPSGSITGAPKVSTMKIIAGLESTLRKIYTGTIGYISPQRQASFNVAIRTLLIERESYKAEYGIGGGVVWDSSSTDEYAEALLKAQVLVQQHPPFSLLETILWTPEEGFFLQEKHIVRMIDSAAYFDIPATRERLEEYLDQISFEIFEPQRVRLMLDQSGKLTHQSSHLETAESHQTLNVCLAKEPVDSNNVFLFHKTTQREVYESARKGLETFDDVLLYNELGELTEFTIGNLIVKLNGQLLTPPISCGVLAGTFRAYLIETGQLLERTITIDQLKSCTKVFRVNSIRQWQRVQIQEQPANLGLERNIS
ncbi:MAG TPA: aminodeoxychorismate synthase component I [Anaerolineales bacterium]